MRHGVACLLTALALTLLLAAPPAACQVATVLYPFTGQGAWPLEQGRANITVGVHLERVLALNQNDQTWRAVHRFHLTWQDPRAQAAVQASTTSWYINGSCHLQCDASQSFEAGCCDGLWLPQIDLPNLLTFDYQVNPPRWRIWVEPVTLADGTTTGLVHWTVRLDGLWFSPYDFRAWPLEHQHLLIEIQPSMAIADRVSLQLGSNVGLVNTPHTKGVDLAGWSINKITPRMYDISACYQQKNTTSWSYNFDPTTGAATPNIIRPSSFLFQTNGRTEITIITQCSDTNIEGTSQYGPYVLVLDMMMLRDKAFYVLIYIVPLIIVDLLVFVVYAMDRANVEARMGVVITLVLALSALQFTYDFPPASYLNVVQQLSLLSYVLFALVCVCSMITSAIARIHERKQRHENLLLAAGLKDLRKTLELGSGKPSTMGMGLGLDSEMSYDSAFDDRPNPPRSSGLFFGATAPSDRWSPPEKLPRVSGGGVQLVPQGSEPSPALPPFPSALMPIAEVDSDRVPVDSARLAPGLPPGGLRGNAGLSAEDPVEDPAGPHPYPYLGGASGGGGQPVAEGVMWNALTRRTAKRNSANGRTPSSVPLSGGAEEPMQDLESAESGEGFPPPRRAVVPPARKASRTVERLTTRGRQHVNRVVSSLQQGARNVHSKISADEAYAQLVARQVDIYTSLFLFFSYIIVVAVLIAVSSSVGDHKLMLAGSVAPGNM